MKEAIEAINRETIKNVKVSEVMKRAWDLAKMIASEYSVSAKSLLSASLKRVWKAVKVVVSISNAYDKRVSLAKIGFTFNETTKAWIKEMTKADALNPQPIRFGKSFIKNFTELFIAEANIRISVVY